MAFGSIAVGASIVVIGLAPTFLVLLVGFGLYGLGSGPMAHSGDVVLVESHPEAPDRIFARSTLVDSVGALLGPLLVSATVWLDLSWRWLLVGLGISSFAYAVVILRTRLPLPAGRAGAAQDGLLQTVRQNIRGVWRSRQARWWLGFLFVFGILETPHRFRTVWLADEVGMSQALIGLYVALELGAGMVGLLLLDRWRQTTSARRILLLASAGVAVLYPAWLLVPGIWPRFVLAVPLELLFAVFWPIGKAQSLASVPGSAGVTTAVHSLFGLVPFALLFGLLADRVMLTTAMLGVHVVVMPVMALVVWQLGKDQLKSRR
jgi:MFS family permease